MPNSTSKINEKFRKPVFYRKRKKEKKKFDFIPIGMNINASHTATVKLQRKNREFENEVLSSRYSDPSHGDSIFRRICHQDLWAPLPEGIFFEQDLRTP